MSIFYFGVTHHTTYFKAIAAQETWGKRLNFTNGIIWYVDKYIKDCSFLNCVIISNNGHDEYNNITQRMLLIWKDVWKHYPHYKWYARVWDDNYIVKENFEDTIKNKNYQ